MNEKKKLPLPILVLLGGIGIGLLFAGFVLYKQIDAKKVNKERETAALKQSEQAVNEAKKRLAEIETEYNDLKTKYDSKADECDAIVTGSEDWFTKSTKCTREKQELQTELFKVEAEQTVLKTKDYTVYYQKVKPMTYLAFYIIGGSIALIAALGAFIIYLVKGKKTY